MFPPFNQELAHHYCQLLISLIKQNKAKLKELTPPSSERLGQGVMLGTLVCVNKKGERVVLCAASGIRVQLEFCCAVEDSLATAGSFATANSLHTSEATFLSVPPIVNSARIQKALLKNDKLIHELTDRLAQANLTQADKTAIIKQRTKLTDESLKKVFSLYKFTRFDAKKVTLDQIILQHNGRLPPTGTGDCCAPKLLSYAFSHNLKPVSMDEVFFGKSTPNKINGMSYEPCNERCGYVLPSILGLEIIYRDSQIVVINKPSMLLSVPGRGEDKQDCVVSRLKKLFPECIDQPSVHRLDMETSGLMVYALTQTAHDNLSRQFEQGKVSKKYTALLDGVLEKAPGMLAPKSEKQGIIKLPFRLDVENRPHQIYDEINGKIGITKWQKEGIEYYYAPDCSKRKVTRVTFEPLTGRTHQLRLASSDIHGFGLPIVGDSLYGTGLSASRLMLYAFELTFYHPFSGQKMNFSVKSNF